VNNRVATKVLDFVGVSRIFAKKALDEISALRNGAKQADELAPETVKLMVETDTIGEHQKKAAESMLQSHAQTMELLQNAVKKIAEMESTEKSASALGQAVDDGNLTGGSYNSLDDPYVGRYTAQKKASDQAMLAVLDN
jgi:hypothetical protein